MRFTMNKLLTCRYNMDTNQMEARFEDCTTLAIDCIAIEDEYGNAPAQRAELDWLLAVVQQAAGICTDGAERGDGASSLAGV